MSQQLRATGDTKVVDQVVERAKLLMVVQEQAAAITSEETEVFKLQVQVSQLTEQVAALNLQHKEGDSRRCFNCNQPGHTEHNCPDQRRERRCFTCRRLGHIIKKVGRKMAEGRLQGAADVPHTGRL